MNKQEAIEKLTNIANGTGWVTCTSACNIISQIHEPQKVVVPKFIADSIEYCKNKEGYGLLRAMDYCDEYNDTGEWLEHNQETFALAWLFGYEIEQEQLYTVELFNGQPLVEVNNILYFSSDLAASNAHVGKDKLEAAGFGWVFDCSGVKVVEVKND
ncbi:TPA: DUF1642 domain-containing protein [Streptococcus suis]|nr:DUF1642 domain-containing protein [Streptococcus suis]HEM4291372.1 DUF1642 domain-containing protein [Streptococcus suis]